MVVNYLKNGQILFSFGIPMSPALSYFSKFLPAGKQSPFLRKTWKHSTDKNRKKIILFPAHFLIFSFKNGRKFYYTSKNFHLMSFSIQPNVFEFLGSRFSLETQKPRKEILLPSKIFIWRVFLFSRFFFFNFEVVARFSLEIQKPRELCEFYVRCPSKLNCHVQCSMYR